MPTATQGEQHPDRVVTPTGLSGAGPGTEKGTRNLPLRGPCHWGQRAGGSLPGSPSTSQHPEPRLLEEPPLGCSAPSCHAHVSLNPGTGGGDSAFPRGPSKGCCLLFTRAVTHRHTHNPIYTDSPTGAHMHKHTHSYIRTQHTHIHIRECAQGHMPLPRARFKAACHPHPRTAVAASSAPTGARVSACGTSGTQRLRARPGFRAQRRLGYPPPGGGDMHMLCARVCGRALSLLLDVARVVSVGCVQCQARTCVHACACVPVCYAMLL